VGELTPQTLTSYEKWDDPLSGGRAEMGRFRLKKTIENPTSNQIYMRWIAMGISLPTNTGFKWF
jgi:hypothetical protein